ncbi:MAG: hypothetical protein VXW87_01305 [Pseudomonadota bacterium]|nr:hypothetical protein [Pseudomonadota bacterium]
MNIHYSYLAGYAIAFVLAMSSAISVSVFLLPIASPIIVVACTISCFFLNLVLFWRDFPNIASSFSDNKISYLARFMTACSSAVLYTFSFFSFQELRMQSRFIKALMPIQMAHALSLLSAIGLYGLYIRDCSDALTTFRTHFPKHILWVTPLILSLVLPIPPLVQAVSLYGLSSWLSFKYDSAQFRDILAAFASITLCVFGYGAYLPLMYSQVTQTIPRLALQTVTMIGMCSLIICDLFFSIETCRKFKIKSTEKQLSILDFLKSLSVMNAIANSQISAQGTGFFSIKAIMGGVMSYITMHNSVTELYNDTKKKAPPFHPDRFAPLQLLGLHAVCATVYGIWLQLYRPIQMRLIKSYFAKKVALSATRGSLCISAIIGGHMALASINEKPQKLVPQPEDHPKGSRPRP